MLTSSQHCSWKPAVIVSHHASHFLAIFTLCSRRWRNPLKTWLQFASIPALPIATFFFCGELVLYACCLSSLLLCVVTFSLLLLLISRVLSRPSFIFPCLSTLRQLLLLCNLSISASLALCHCVLSQMCTVPALLFKCVYLWGILSVLWLSPGVGWISLLSGVDPVLSCPVLSSALSVWMEQCASTASLLASVREQERQFEMLSRALEEERRSCAGTLPRPLPNMQVTLIKPPSTYPHAHSSIEMSLGFTIWSGWTPRSPPPLIPYILSVWTRWMAAEPKPYLGTKVPPLWVSVSWVGLDVLIEELNVTEILEV